MFVVVFPLTDQDDEENAEGEQAAGTSFQSEEPTESEEPQTPQPPQKSPRRGGKQVKVETPRKTRASAAAAEEATPRRGAIADTVKRMKNVLSPPKLTQEGINFPYNKTRNW